MKNQNIIGFVVPAFGLAFCIFVIIISTQRDTLSLIFWIFSSCAFLAGLFWHFLSIFKKPK